MSSPVSWIVLQVGLEPNTITSAVFLIHYWTLPCEERLGTDLHGSKEQKSTWHSTLCSMADKNEVAARGLGRSDVLSWPRKTQPWIEAPNPSVALSNGMSFLGKGMTCSGSPPGLSGERVVTSNGTILPKKEKDVFAFPSCGVEDNLVFCSRETLMKTVFLEIVLTSNQMWICCPMGFLILLNISYTPLSLEGHRLTKEPPRRQWRTGCSPKADPPCWTCSVLPPNLMHRASHLSFLGSSRGLALLGSRRFLPSGIFLI